VKKAPSGRTAGRGFFLANRSGCGKFFATFPYYGKFSRNVSGATDSLAIDCSRPVFLAQLLSAEKITL
jgi:hypothetical protein